VAVGPHRDAPQASEYVHSLLLLCHTACHAHKLAIALTPERGACAQVSERGEAGGPRVPRGADADREPGSVAQAGLLVGRRPALPAGSPPARARVLPAPNSRLTACCLLSLAVAQRVQSGRFSIRLARLCVGLSARTARLPPPSPSSHSHCLQYLIVVRSTSSSSPT
jgi:hypothetical protein